MGAGIVRGEAGGKGPGVACYGAVGEEMGWNAAHSGFTHLKVWLLYDSLFFLWEAVFQLSEQVASEPFPQLFLLRDRAP